MRSFFLQRNHHFIASQEPERPWWVVAGERGRAGRTQMVGGDEVIEFGGFLRDVRFVRQAGKAHNGNSRRRQCFQLDLRVVGHRLEKTGN